MVHKGRKTASYMPGIRKRALCLILSLILMCALLSGCEKRRYVLTTAFEKNELMRINGKSCYLPEMMLYLTTVQNRYKEVYGPEIFERTVDGVSIADRLKDMVLAKVAQIKAMNLMAESYGLKLTEEENRQVFERAEAFYQTLNAKERETIGVKADDIRKYYTEYALADKVYDHVIKDINPEISDDEARIVTVWHILIKTYSLDAEGNRVKYSERAMKEAYETARLVHELAVSGEDSFESIAAKYSEDPELSYTFGRGEMSEKIEEVAFSLDKDAVSDIVETESGYHIIKCVSDFDVDMTQENKIAILKQRRETAFDETYDAFVEGLTKTLNRKLYDSIELIRDEEVVTSDFFDVEF